MSPLRSEESERKIYPNRRLSRSKESEREIRTRAAKMTELEFTFIFFEEPTEVLGCAHASVSHEGGVAATARHTGTVRVWCECVCV